MHCISASVSYSPFFPPLTPKPPSPLFSCSPSPSSVTFIRLADGAQQQASGPLLELDAVPDEQPFPMKFAVPLLAGHSYELLLNPPLGSSFVPQNLTIQLADGGATVCSEPVTVRIRAVGGRQWQVFGSDGASMPE